MTLALDAGGRPTYTVMRDDAVPIAPPPIGLELDTDKIGYAMRVTDQDHASADALPDRRRQGGGGATGTIS